jgi:hypothetical protein
MRVVFATCCETVIQDFRSNNLSLINLMDQLNAVGFPIVAQKLCFVALLDRSQEEPSTTLARLVGKLNGIEVFSFEAAIDFQGQLRTRTVGEFQGIFIQAPGMLKLSLMRESEELTSVTIEIKHIGNPQGQLFTGPNTLQPQ